MAMPASITNPADQALYRANGDITKVYVITPHQEYPRMLYKDGAETVVADETACEAYLAMGWSKHPGGDPVEVEEKSEKRGPGRPKKDHA